MAEGSHATRWQQVPISKRAQLAAGPDLIQFLSDFEVICHG